MKKSYLDDHFGALYAILFVFFIILVWLIWETHANHRREMDQLTETQMKIMELRYKKY